VGSKKSCQLWLVQVLPRLIYFIISWFRIEVLTYDLRHTAGDAHAEAGTSDGASRRSISRLAREDERRQAEAEGRLAGGGELDLQWTIEVFPLQNTLLKNGLHEYVEGAC